ncbi:MAG: transposase [Alphaproteobacteria bacterium]|nr:transposase [Alphaproteobacteria bacterium]
MVDLSEKNALYNILQNIFYSILKDEKDYNKIRIFELIIPIFIFNNFKSVKSCIDFSVEHISQYKKSSFYNTVNDPRLNIENWTDNILLYIDDIIEKYGVKKQYMISSLDDSLSIKAGTHFEGIKNLFDHTNRKNQKYVLAHDIVTILSAIPIVDNNIKDYIEIPVASKVKEENETKLEIASNLVTKIYNHFHEKMNLLFCFDSWFPKGIFLKTLIDLNVDIICSVKSNTVLYEPEPSNSKNKRGPKSKHGRKLNIKDSNDFKLIPIPNSHIMMSARPVKSRLFGDKLVYALVTYFPKKKSYHLFICTNINIVDQFDFSFIAEEEAKKFVNTNSNFIIYAIYKERWKIETTFYQQKKFWGIDKYMVRSFVGIENIVNILNLTYAIMSMIPYIDNNFIKLKNKSNQIKRYEIGIRIYELIILNKIIEYIPDTNNKNIIENFLNEMISNLSL